MWWRCTNRVRRGLRRFTAVLQMIQNLVHDRRVSGNHLDAAAALVAGFNLEQVPSSKQTLKHVYLNGPERVVSASSGCCESVIRLFSLHPESPGHEELFVRRHQLT
jgi:hypothetical protein